MYLWTHEFHFHRLSHFLLALLFGYKTIVYLFFSRFTRAVCVFTCILSVRNIYISVCVFIY